jgi:hypothetical protein
VVSQPAFGEQRSLQVGHFAFPVELNIDFPLFPTYAESCLQI